jgi:hypothetical protein
MVMEMWNLQNLSHLKYLRYLRYSTTIMVTKIMTSVILYRTIIPRERSRPVLNALIMSASVLWWHLAVALLSDVAFATMIVPFFRHCE